MLNWNSRIREKRTKIIFEKINTEYFPEMFKDVYSKLINSQLKKPDKFLAGQIKRYPQVCIQK